MFRAMVMPIFRSIRL